MVAALYEGAIVGLMSNYVPVPHKELLDMIKDAGLADRIIHWNLSVTGLRVDISLRSAVEETRNKLIAALSIDNGHSGHYALRYRAAVRVDDFEWRLPLSGKRRHLSKVHLAVANFSASLDQVQDLRIEDKRLRGDLRFYSTPASQEVRTIVTEGHREMSAPAALYAVSLPAVDRGSEEMLTGI